MQNFALLRAAGRSGKPILLKRGGGATIEEWLSAAEYILADGNEQVILCERGIRTFERATRHTLDLNGVALVRERTHLPVIVDPSHAAGIRSIVAPLALAGLAAGAHGVLVEVHPHPEAALSDGRAEPGSSRVSPRWRGAGTVQGRLIAARTDALRAARPSSAATRRGSPADRLATENARDSGAGVARAQRGRELPELPGHRVDRAGERLRIGERELEREGHGLARQPRRVEQARARRAVRGRRPPPARGRGERARDGVGQVADPGHQAVVPLGVEHDGARADAATSAETAAIDARVAARRAHEHPGAAAEDLGRGGLDAAAARAGHRMTGHEARRGRAAPPSPRRSAS